MIYNPDDFGYDPDNCGLYIKDSGIHHGGLTGLEDNDHYLYATGVTGEPLTYANQAITFHYDTDDFIIDASGNLQLKVLHNGLESDAPISVSGNHIELLYDTDDFQLSGEYLQIDDYGIHHGGLYGLSENDHTIYAIGVDGCPLSYDNQLIKFNYDETMFDVDGECKLTFIGSGNVDHNSLLGIDGGISGEYYHMSNTEHSNLHVPGTVNSAPLTISGQEITFNYDTDDFDVDGNNLILKTSGLPSGEQYNTLRYENDGNVAVATDNIEIYDDGSAVTTDHNTGTDPRLTNFIYIASGDIAPDASGYAIGTVLLVYNP